MLWCNKRDVQVSSFFLTAQQRNGPGDERRDEKSKQAVNTGMRRTFCTKACIL